MSAGAERTRLWRQRRAQGLTTPRPARPAITPRLSATEVLVNKLAGSVLAPNLRGAACSGLWATFDAKRPAESELAAADRHRYAIELCGRCPVRDACAAWIAALPARERPPGVVAGRALDEESR